MAHLKRISKYIMKRKHDSKSWSQVTKIKSPVGLWIIRPMYTHSSNINNISIQKKIKGNRFLAFRTGHYSFQLNKFVPFKSWYNCLCIVWLVHHTLNWLQNICILKLFQGVIPIYAITFCYSWHVPSQPLHSTFI